MPGWSVRFDRRAERDLARLGSQDQTRVLRFLRDRVAGSPDPRALGAALRGPLAGKWKYRVGDVRIIAEIRDSQLLILVIEVGNRREIYR
ncbi:MAG: type II toxin-antitoxin system RelE family toxin [Devosia sp.]|jgi:mRNA interferase RelE/StbE